MAVLTNLTGTPWETMVQDRIKMYGADVGDPKARARGCQAIFCAGSTLKLWNEATELKIALLAAAAVREGQKIQVVGKYADDSGLTAALESLVGDKGKVTVTEIGPQAIAAVSGTGKKLQWGFDYFAKVRDASVDRVILFNTASHIKNLKSAAVEISRVLKNGGRVVIAEAPWWGPELLAGAGMEMHINAFFNTVINGMGLKEDDLPSAGAADVEAALKPVLGWSRSFSWQGLYLIYGQKGQSRGVKKYEGPAPTTAVETFLEVKPEKTPWDFLSAAEKEAFPGITDAEYQKKWGRVIAFGGSVDWAYEKSASVVKPMWNALRVKKGDKAIVIGEFLDKLFVPELRRRVGEKAEISVNNINQIHRVIFEKMQRGEYIPMEVRHQWDYPFADKYPDNYFDLVWLPQGVHHVNSWKKIAPRLMRVLKPGGQFMAIEWRLNEPEFHYALNTSRFLRVIAEKIWWAVGVSIEEMPDYPTAVLTRAFSDYLSDIYEIEWKGFLFFYGTKKG